MVLRFPTGEQNIAKNFLFLESKEEAQGFSPKKGETLFWSCMGINFHASNPDTDAVHTNPSDGGMTADATVTFTANVNLPQGAVVTGVIVYGSESNEPWFLFRSQLSNPAADTLATANMNTADTSISNATVDNNIYGYYLATDSLDNTDVIYGARITYQF